MKKFVIYCLLIIPLSSCSVTPDEPTIDRTVWLDQGWTDKQRHWFHHNSQGTATLPVPYEWFMELEQPLAKDNWFKGLLGAENKFSNWKYLQKFGFVPSMQSSANPHALPVGFAVTPNLKEPTSGRVYNAIGLTCAACHTGQLTYQGTSIHVDGGPAVTNLTDMIKAMIVSLVETDFAKPRGKRFKTAVIKRVQRENPHISKKEAEENFEETKTYVKGYIAAQAKSAIKTAKESVPEGFTRLDALNRIGNTVFGAYNSDNIAPTNAPVNYPHIWSTSWFDWVQYDASIMQPMIRNAGEALGVAAPVQLQAGSNQFASLVKVVSLYHMETLLGGAENPQKARAFTGLKAPRWPEDVLGKIDLIKAKKGEKHYQNLCKGCHLPPVSSPEFWSDKHWKKINGKGENYLKLNVIPVSEIGTDAAQSEVLATRTVNLEGMGNAMNDQVCGVVEGKWTTVKVSPAQNQSFAFALGLAVERTTQHFYKEHNIAPEKQQKMNGDRPNCLQAPGAYKARPLNGIWATAPFLHNGSVANLYDMLVPASQRAPILYLGYREFDPKKVGYLSTVGPNGLTGSTKGLTKVVVSGPDARKGNFNSGHEFSNDQGNPGVIGRLLSDPERWELVEYLKTL